METGDSQIKQTSGSDPGPPRRPRVSSQEAAERLIETTILLMREGPFNNLTVRNIAAHANLNNSTIERCFGSIENLYREAARELALQSVDRLADSPDPTPLADPDFALTVRFRAWLLTNGTDPSRFLARDDQPLSEALKNRQLRIHNISPLTAQTLNELVSFIFEGYAVFNESHGINDEIRLNILAMTYAILESLPTLETTLGWEGRSAVEFSEPRSTDQTAR